MRLASGWKSQQDTPGALQLGYVTYVFRPRQWFNLIPDQIHSIVTDGFGSYDGSTTNEHAGNSTPTITRTPTVTRTPTGTRTPTIA